MRHYTKKRAARNRSVAKFRRELVAEVGHCECCGHDPARVPFGSIAWRLDCHEISNGALRCKSLDQRYCLLVLCWMCNSELMTDKATWPVSRQLSLLKASRPQDYNLAEYLRLRNPNAMMAITEEEVEAWL